MRRVDQLFDEYAQSHRHPVNKAIHWVCIPLITWSLLGLLAAAPFPFAAPPLSWAAVALAGALLYYVRLSPRLAAGVLVISIPAMLALEWLAAWEALPLWASSLLIFALAWVGQFIGHALEGKKPSFFKDLQFLLIGPAWLLGHVYRRLGVAY